MTELKKTIWINASPERVFEYLTDADVTVVSHDFQRGLIASANLSVQFS